MVAELLLTIENEGERSELAKFYERYKNKFYALIISKINDENAAEDILQEAFLKIISYPKTFFEIPAHKKPAYVVTIIRNIIYDDCRKKIKADELSADISDNALPLEDIVIGKIAREELISFIKRLPEAQSTALILRFVHDMTYPEIAQTLGISEAAARKRVSDGYRKIRQYAERGEYYV